MKQRYFGQSMAETGLVLALVSVVAIGGLTSLGGSIASQLTEVSTALTNAGAGTKAIAVAAPSTPGTPSTGQAQNTPIGNPPGETQTSTVTPPTPGASPSFTTDSHQTLQTPASQPVLGDSAVTTNPADQNTTTPVSTPTNSPIAANPGNGNLDASGNATFGCQGSGCASSYNSNYSGW